MLPQIVNGTVTGETVGGLPRPALGIQWQQAADKRLLISGYDQTSPDLYSAQVVDS